MPQPVLTQAVVLGSDLRGRTRMIRVTAAVAYVHPRKARPEPIAGTTDFQVIIEMGKVGARAPDNESWRELM